MAEAPPGAPKREAYEQPKTVGPERLRELLEAASPAQELGQYLIGVSHACGEQYAEDDPVEELTRRVKVAEHRGRHVLAPMRTGALFEALEWDADTLQRVVERAKRDLDQSRAMERDIVRRYEAVLELKRVADRGDLNADDVPLLVPLLVLTRSDVRYTPVTPQGDFAELLSRVAAQLGTLEQMAPDFMALAGDELRALVEQVQA